MERLVGQEAPGGTGPLTLTLTMPLPPASMLRVIKVVHTVAWAALVVLTAVMLTDVAVLLVNGWKCPLTLVAARYTDDRRPNFDISLPLWLAANNKTIFGTIFVGGLMFSVWRLAR